MLEALVPKITDISNIKGISTLLALPMLCVAYFLQTGASISWGDTLWIGLGGNLPPETELRRLILIFVLKSIWISFFGLSSYVLLTSIYIKIEFPLIELASVLMIGFSLFVIFCSTQFPQLKSIDPIWSYGLIVWGVFLQAMKDQLDTERRKREALTEENTKSNKRAG